MAEKPLTVGTSDVAERKDLPECPTKDIAPTTNGTRLCEVKEECRSGSKYFHFPFLIIFYGSTSLSE